MISQLQRRSLQGSGIQSRLSPEAASIYLFFLFNGHYICCAWVAAHHANQCCSNWREGHCALMVMAGDRMTMWWTGAESLPCPGLIAGFPSSPLVEGPDSRLKMGLTSTGSCSDINALIYFSLLFWIKTIMLNLLLLMTIWGLHKGSLNNQGFLKKNLQNTHFLVHKCWNLESVPVYMPVSDSSLKYPAKWTF